MVIPNSSNESLKSPSKTLRGTDKKKASQSQDVLKLKGLHWMHYDDGITGIRPDLFWLHSKLIEK